MSYQLYWGDLHSHCSISYGHGTVEQALLRARQQLDFCSVTGHAFWPDMPTDRSRYGEIIDYHQQGFATLARNWKQLVSAQSIATRDHEFVAFPSYEWHSLQYGDHNIYAMGPDLALVDAPDVAALRTHCRSAATIMIPHHIGYAAGYRGINWDHFHAASSPFVEIMSLHGCSLSEDAPYPMLHDMGPRDGASLADHGWRLGHRFGIVGGTDHHAAFPGSHGDGRMGVFATGLTRSELWEALLNRRVFAATGDCIDARMLIDGAWIGSEIQNSKTRHIEIDVRAVHQLDRVELVKNGRLMHRFVCDGADPADRYRLRVTWGWGRKDQTVNWQSKLTLSEGAITDVETHFSGQAVAAPQGVAGHSVGEDSVDLPHQIIERSDHTVAWSSVTAGNTTMRHATTQALTLELDAPASAILTLEANGNRYQHQLGDLLRNGNAHYMNGWLTEAIQISRLIPANECSLRATINDQPEREVDIYRLQVAQTNGQWAWLSPIWVEC